MLQYSRKVKKVFLQSEHQQPDEREGEEASDVECLASSQRAAKPEMLKVEGAFPDLQLFDSVKSFLRSPDGLGIKAFTDRQSYPKN